MTFNEQTREWEARKPVQSFSAIWSDKLGKAIAENCQADYPIECHQGSETFEALVSAVNQGIDSHLEAVFFKEFKGEHGRRGFRIESKSVPTLVRRLMESGDDTQADLASAICSTLNIELI